MDLHVLNGDGNAQVNRSEWSDAGLKVHLGNFIQSNGLTAGQSFDVLVNGMKVDKLSITAADLALGYKDIQIAAAQLKLMDSNTIAVQGVTLAGVTKTSSLAVQMAVAPSPALLTPSSGGSLVLKADTTALSFDLTQSDLKADDKVQWQIDGTNLGSFHAVTTAEATAKRVMQSVLPGNLGAEGTHTVSAVVTGVMGKCDSQQHAVSTVRRHCTSGATGPASRWCHCDSEQCAQQ